MNTRERLAWLKQHLFFMFYLNELRKPYIEKRERQRKLREKSEQKKPEQQEDQEDTNQEDSEEDSQADGLMGEGDIMFPEEI